MASNKQLGDLGEREVIDLVACPNCGKKLMTLPANYPLYDIQCTGCSFRAQVKTNKSKPKKEIFGAGWEIMDKVLKSGFLTPALITNFKWKDKTNIKREIRFYPFVPKSNLKKRLAKIKRNNRKHWMFNYIDLDKLPYLILYRK
jgi:DNA-directed RNA polymerase subunit RPC12/RpoP